MADWMGDFLSGFDDSRFPDGLLQKYEPMECLANNAMGETLLLRDRCSDTCYVAKCYMDRSLLSSETESTLLKRLHHDGLPVFVEEYQSDAMLCVVREYARGVPLSQMKIPLSEPQILSIGMQLCDILSYLHGQTPPVIHRDLKPQNIIMDENGKVKLIDFGISRLYDETAKTDTVFFGTQEFAPPEQYGFSQTDARTDIFSLGVVLLWLVTGKTQIAHAHIRNRRLARVIRKCTAFAPGSRYHDAKSVRHALAGTDGHRQKTALRACCAGLALFAALSAGFTLGRFTDFRPALFYDNRVAVFTEPLIERAVRLQLGKAEGETILREELDQVTELYLYCDQTAKTWEECNALRGGIDDGTITVSDATVSTLKDVAMLKNLKKLSLGNQDITDISALAGLTKLTLLELDKCPVQDISVIASFKDLKHISLSQCEEVTDISPLANCKNLSELVLSGCRADDFSPLAALGDIEYLFLQDVDPAKFLPCLKGKAVRQLHLGYRLLSSITDLAGISGLEELYFDQVRLPSLSGINCLPGLVDIHLLGMPDLDLTPLETLPYLQTVTLSDDMREAARAIADSASFDIVYQQ